MIVIVGSIFYDIMKYSVQKYRKLPRFLVLRQKLAAGSNVWLLYDGLKDFIRLFGYIGEVTYAFVIPGNQDSRFNLHRTCAHLDLSMAVMSPCQLNRLMLALQAAICQIVASPSVVFPHESSENRNCCCPEGTLYCRRWSENLSRHMPRMSRGSAKLCACRQTS